MQAERGRVQTRGRVTEVGFLDPQQGGAVLALLALAVAAALVAHRQQGDEQDGEDGEGVEEDEVEEGLVGADDRVDGGLCGRDGQTDKRASVRWRRRRVSDCVGATCEAVRSARGCTLRTGYRPGNMAVQRILLLATCGTATNKSHGPKKDFSQNPKIKAFKRANSMTVT